MNSEARQRLLRSVPYNRTSWFDLLDQNGFLIKWLDSDDEERFWYAVDLMTQPAIVKERGSVIARLLQDRFGSDQNSDNFKRVCRAVFSNSDFLLTEELFQLFLKQFRDGAFDNEGSLYWGQFHSLADVSSKRGLTLVKEFLVRRQQLVPEGKVKDLFSFPEDKGLPSNLLHRLAQVDPLGTVQILLPFVADLIKGNHIEEADDLARNEIWPFVTQNLHSDFKYRLIEALREAMGNLARQYPENLDLLTRGLEQSNDRVITYLLLSSWSENGQFFGNRIVDYLLANEKRLNLGLDTWGSGNGIAAVSRAAVTAAAPAASPEKMTLLEDRILKFHPPEEKKTPQRFGLLEFLLLNAMGESRLSQNGLKRYQEVSRKFGDVIETAPPTRSSGGGFVGSPIPTTAPARMTDQNWLDAMRTYESEDPEIRRREDFLTGGAVEVSRQLAREAEHNKERFAKLALSMGDDIRPIYFDAILRALVADKEEHTHPAQGKPADLPPLSDDKLFPVLRHVHGLEGHPCGRWLCDAIGHIATRALPDDILAMAAFYCMHDPDPEGEESEKRYFGGDLVQYGINTTRGAAANAIAELLRTDANRWPQLEQAVLSATEDRAASVRACSVHCLISMLAIDKARALDLFLKVVGSDKDIQGSVFTQDFLARRAYADYQRLRPLVLSMLASGIPDQAQMAGSCIAAAGFEQPMARDDLSKVLAGDEAGRAGLAVFAAEQFVRREPIALNAARQWLMALFNDEARRVRDIASSCFHHLDAKYLEEEPDVISAFIDSKSFEEHAYSLIHAVEGSVSRLPDVILKIPMKAVSLHESETNGQAGHARWWTNDIAKLVLRLYEQTPDELTRTQCLDLLDRMIELNFGSFSKELEKVDRSQKK